MKIAFLFLTIGDLNHEYLWREYFKGNEEKYNIYCHPKDKYNVKSDWLKKYIIDKNVTTTWGNTIYAILELLSDALKDKKNDFFLLLSESCVPIKSFNKFYKFLKNNKDKSFIKKYKCGVSKYDIEVRLKYFEFDRDLLIKHYANWILNRNHTKKLLLKKNILNNFTNIKNADEYLLSVLDNRKNIINYEIINVDWDYTENFSNMINDLRLNKRYEKYKYILKKIYQEIAQHPRTYVKINKLIINELIKSESFFARKFDKNSNILEFKDQLLAS